jgi:hypothetical protein
MSPDELEMEIFQRIDAAIRDDARPIGLLFHGTGEPIKGPLMPGGYDNVLWTSDSPVIAQSYIPNSGITMYMSRPSSYRMTDRVRPQEHSGWNELAKQMSGQECFDIAYQHGEVSSWRVPSDWPTYGDCWAFLTSQNGLGYPDEETIEVSQSGSAEGWKFMPATYQLPGHLFVTLGDPENFSDLRQSDEPDLTSVEYHQTEAFETAWSQQKFGVMINDFAQMKRWGNVGHNSYGLSPETAAATQWIAIPATHYEPTDWDEFSKLTPELKAWHTAMQDKYAVPGLTR